MTDNSKIHLVKKLDVTDLAGEKVMIDFSTGKYFLLKGSANDIWDYIQTPITVGEIMEKLLAEYEVTPEECRYNILTFLERLNDYGFIEIKEA